MGLNVFAGVYGVQMIFATRTRREIVKKRIPKKSLKAEKTHIIVLSVSLLPVFSFLDWDFNLLLLLRRGITENQVYITNRCNLTPQTPRLFLPAFLSSRWLREEKINPKSQSHSKAWERRADLIKTGMGLAIEIRRSLAIKRRQNWHKISLSWSRCGESIGPGTEESIETLELCYPNGSRGWIPNSICGMLIASRTLSGLWTQAKQAKYNKFINSLRRSITFNNSILINIHFTAFVFVSSRTPLSRRVKCLF